MQLTISSRLNRILVSSASFSTTCNRKSLEFEAANIQHEALLKTFYQFKIWSIIYLTIQLKRAFLDEPVTRENCLHAIETVKNEINFENNVYYFPFRVLLRALEACEYSIVHGRFIRKMQNWFVGSEDDSPRISDKVCVRELGILLISFYN